MAGGRLEIAKFAIYLAIPVAFTFYVVNPENMLSFLRWRRYIQYPAEGPKPPTSTEEVRAHFEAMKQRKAAKNE